MTIRHRVYLPIVVLLISLLSADAFALAPDNELTESEKRSGWQLLFDGKTTDGWRNFKKDKVNDGWKVVGGELRMTGKGAGDIMTKEMYKHFELQLEYKISKGGNSGLMFHVTEEANTPWKTGPEIQIQDNVDAHDPQLAGWLYQLYKPGTVPGWAKEQLKAAGADVDARFDTTRPADEWNQIYLRIGPDGGQVCMNGVRYYNFKKGSDDWNKKVAASKFAKFEKFGKPESGHLCLQDHGNKVAFRNIKLRVLGEDSKVANPVHGSIEVVGKPAFPKLEWEGWESESDDGKIQKLRTIVMTSVGDTIYTASQRGMIHKFKNDPDATKADLVIDLRDQVKSFTEPGANEEGLLGLALHPKFAEKNLFYVYYTSKKEKQTSIISEFTMKDGKADKSSERVLMKIPQPFMNHNGGSIEFGHDGFLYVGMGDGGLANDPYSAAQDLTNLMGKILRIDVDKRDINDAYGVPSDNPFLKRDEALPEIYAYGIRNAWRISFDQATGHLWFADVGQELWEEINVVEKGGNYGWSVREGAHIFKNGSVDETDPMIDPIWEYDHRIGRSITGGHVCRSSRIPELNGKYVYADFVSGRIWALAYDPTGSKPTQNFNLIDGGQPVLAFGQDSKGEVYYCLESPKAQTIMKFEKK